MGKVKGFMLNRKQYDKIRKMDHCTMTLWAESVYKSGYRDGAEASPGLTEEEMRGIILQVRGIGEKKAELICSALVQGLDAKKGKKSD